MASLKEGVPTKRVYNDFSGGVNNYLGSRQVKDTESPDAINCDFKGQTGVGNRQGYAQIGAVADSRTAIYGMAEYHNSTKDQLIKFASNGSNVALYHSTDGAAWTAVTGTTFTDAKNMEVVQALSLVGDPLNFTATDGTLFSFNGTSTMVKYDGTSWASHTGAKTLLYGALYDNRLWGVDPTYQDVILFSTKSPDATKPFHFTEAGTSSGFGTINFRPGSGVKIIGMKVFKSYLYIFTESSIFRISPASAANTFTVESVTDSVGCVSHRSIVQVEEDLFFASNDGVYSLGEVANYTSVRTTNKSLRMQTIFDALSGASKKKLAAVYFNFKYHLFYPQFGGQNDSCIAYDIRYKAWQDWRNMAGQDATLYTDSTGVKGMYFGQPSTGKVMQMYSGTTDDGTAISTSWYSKSFDEDQPDTVKLYFSSTFIFGDLGGSVSVKVIFNDSEITATQSISQQQPQGGFGMSAFGRVPFGANPNTVTVTQVINQPQRLKAKGKKFAIQYAVTSTGQWRLDGITQLFQAFGYYKFPSANKLN